MTKKNRAARLKLTAAVAAVGGGVLKRAEEALLLTTFFFVESLSSAPTSRGAWEAYRRALTDLADVQTADALDEETLVSFKRAWQRLRQKGLIGLFKEKLVTKPRITAAGMRRLQALFPTYDRRRDWDGRIYLITYDIPEAQRGKRETLRRILQKLGAGALQFSVYLTPYDPRANLKKLLKGTGIAEQVIVADFGQDGNVGEKSLRRLMDGIYHLTELNRRYREYLEEHARRDLSPTEKMHAVTGFYAILETDPQLPWPLLPKNWLGQEAYRCCRRQLGY